MNISDAPKFLPRTELNVRREFVVRSFHIELIADGDICNPSSTPAFSVEAVCYMYGKQYFSYCAAIIDLDDLDDYMIINNARCINFQEFKNAVESEIKKFISGL